MKFKSVKFLGLILLGVFLIIIWSAIFFTPENKEMEATADDKNKIEEEITEFEDKQEVTDYSLEKSESSRLPVAVMIDNFSESWPLTGINQAAIVYEAPVEADITRLLAIFSQDYLPGKIGPVRSARPYFAEWAEEYGSLFVHAGGSQDFLDKIKTGDYQIYNLDEISSDGVYFWRDETRDKPHNLYTSKDLIEKSIEDKGLNNQLKSSFIPKQFNGTSSLNETAANLIIEIDYREPVVWQFDKELKSYLRFQNGQPFVDENNEQVKTSNLIIQKTEIRILDEIGHRFIKTIDQGEALIFQNGHLIQGIWRKTSADQQTNFYNQQNQEIKFLPGNIWVEVVSKNHQLVY